MDIPSGANTSVKQPTWEIAEVIINVMLENLSSFSKRPVSFDAQTMASLHAMYERGPMLFWTVLDQFYEAALRKEWPEDKSENVMRFHVLQLLATIHPIVCEVPEAEFALMLIRKLWPGDEEDSPTGTSSSSPHSGPSQSQRNSTDLDSRYYRVPPLEDDVVENAVRNVYTWTAAEKVLQQIGDRLTKEVGRVVAFDEMHVNKIRQRYEEDPLGFWSVLDQMQEQLMGADWKSVRNDARFIQSFLHKYTPLDKQLTEFMSVAIPRHPLVPYSSPPTLLRTLRGSHVSCENSPKSNSPTSISAPVSGCCSASESPKLTPKFPTPSTAQEGGAFGHKHQQPTHSSNPTTPTSVRRRGSQTPPPPQFSGSDINSPSGRSCCSSKPSSDAGDDVEDETSDPHYPYTWRAAEAAMLAVEQKLLEKSGREIVFDEKHRHALLCKWEQDAKGFFSVLDQVQERLMQSKWDTVRDVGGYIQSLIGRFEPQPIVSKFIQSFVMTPEVAAETAALEAESSEIVAIPWNVIFDVIIPAVEEHTSICVGRTVRFDDKHKYHMKQRYDRNILSFWSVFDQVQERMASSDWSTVRDDARFIQSFITRSEPRLPLVLSPFLAAVTDAIINGTDVQAAVAAHSKPNSSTSGSTPASSPSPPPPSK